MLLGAASASYGNEPFGQVIQPLLREYCLTCHSTADKKGELDLERFQSIEQVKQHPAVWQAVLEQLAHNEMPPKDKRQPTAEQKRAIAAWVQATLDEVSLASAGDPGPVVLRRLSHAEYTYTLHDLTGVATLDPTREFPIDGAAGEGFTNAGAALVMSPSLLTKYLDAAKEVAEHAVLLPDGIRFSPHTSPRDWTDESLIKIREFYARYSSSGGATAVNLQGIKFDTNSGGRLPVEKYVAALLKERASLLVGKKQLGEVAQANSLNEKYLTRLWNALNSRDTSLLLKDIQKLFHDAKPDDATAVIRAIEAWQQSLWRFTSVGHIGKLSGPKSWQEGVTPLVSRHEMRLKLAAPADGGDVTVYLATSDAGDGHEHDFAVWENARLVSPGRVDLPLRNIRAAIQTLSQQRDAIVASSVKCLAAAAEADTVDERIDVATLARKHDVEPTLLAAWLDYLGIGTSGEVKLEPLLSKKMSGTPDYNFIQGWTGADALSVLANSSDASVRIPGHMNAHGVAVHPAPKFAVVTAWRSPAACTLRIDGSVQDAHPECGNGFTWALELRRGHRRDRLAGGVSNGATVANISGIENVRVFAGDVVALVIGPREGNHVCDLTAVDLSLHDGQREWNLAKDISPNILAGNPHADGYGNKDVWHFLSEPAVAEPAAAIPTGSLLAEWRKSTQPAERLRLAAQVQQLLDRTLESLAADSPDRELHRQLLAFNGPLLSATLGSLNVTADTDASSPYGLNPNVFGKHPRGESVEPFNLCVQAPSVIEVRLPASLAAGAEIVATGRLHPGSSLEGSVQMQLLATKPEQSSGIVAGQAVNTVANGQWSDNNLRTNYRSPIIVGDSSHARRRFEKTFDDFRQLFPAVLCYTKIVPVDEVVTLTLFYREDDHLKRLMLDDTQAATLDRLWDELAFVSESPLKQVDAFEQLYQFATQDANPSAFEPLREPIMKQAAAFKKRLIDVEPRHVQAVLDFAALAWRRPLTIAEQSELQTLYSKLRQQQLSHEMAVRMLLGRVLVSPAFLYRGEVAAAGAKASPVNDWELATRLSYFLWSSAPDAELRALAASGRLQDPAVLASQTRRMINDAKVRRLALEFGCQWLHIRDLASLDEKSERHFPTFNALRGDMLEEATQFFIDLFQHDRSVLSLLDADYSFLNGPLARHYGITVKSDDWQRVDDIRVAGRGGVIGFAATLAKQSGASRTSPILRGNWISEVVLGEKLPRPPKGVPVLPDEAPAGLTERQLIELHSTDPKCASCHERIDPLGFALEGYDAIGRARTNDSAGLSINAQVRLADGTEFAGLAGLRNYLSKTRRDDFLRQFCRKLLGYSLGRSVQLSDKPLLDQMLKQLKANDFRIGVAIESIVLSPQFREVRGRNFAANH